TNSGSISGNSVSLNETGAYSSIINTGTISATSYLYINEQAYSPVGFENASTGIITLSGGNGQIYQNLSPFDNEGTIAVTSGATLSLGIFDSYYNFPHTNNGVISVASGGHLTFDGSGSPLSGSGSFVINDGGLLELHSGTVANTVDF